jgi:hypothetical protein
MAWSGVSSTFIIWFGSEAADDQGYVRLDFLHFQNDPELLIVHHTAGSAGIRINADGQAETYESRSWRYRALSRLVPVQSSEIHGYPFWMLRITEI